MLFGKFLSFNIETIVHVHPDQILEKSVLNDLGATCYNYIYFMHFTNKTPNKVKIQQNF